MVFMLLCLVRVCVSVLCGLVMILIMFFGMFEVVSICVSVSVVMGLFCEGMVMMVLFMVIVGSISDMKFVNVLLLGVMIFIMLCGLCCIWVRWLGFVVIVVLLNLLVKFV